MAISGYILSNILSDILSDMLSDILSDTLSNMMDGWPAGYDGWMATIHDGWMEEKRERLGPGPGPQGPALPFFFHPSIMDGGHPSIIAGRPSIHHIG